MDFFYDAGVVELREHGTATVLDILEASWGRLETAARLWAGLFGLQLGEDPPDDWTERIRAVMKDGCMILEEGSEDEEGESGSEGSDSDYDDDGSGSE